MTDTLTACARAMYNSWHDHGRRLAVPWDMLTDVDRSFWIASTRACLTALAENVSEGMVEAGINESSFHGIDPLAVSAEVVGTFTAMIRAAVGERG
ncbi:hypothetical protein [Rhizorhabdus wittichii]|uniref:hypothetical protein n=1 Tax=Rhizorhabdus wittichii TaxID=160791 RepID=UPI0012FD337E|nr:hypothetical protein [Rhizorhabdus wittichii]